MELPHPDFIDATELRAATAEADWEKTMVIIDVREKEERERYGSIPQSVHVLSELFEDDDGIEAVDEHAKGKTTVVFHCQYSQQRGPFCAQRYCAALSGRDNAADTKVLILRGGFRSWRRTRE